MGSTIYAGDFSPGDTFEMNGEPFVVLTHLHVKPGKGAAFERTKYQNVKTGVIREDTFGPDDKFDRAIIETKMMTYSYPDGELYYFMDPETFEIIPLEASKLENAIPYIRENDTVTMKFYKDTPFFVAPPNSVELEVIDCEPGVKGNTATNVRKAATVETGAVIQVPIFIERGEVIKIDTRTGEYIGRVSK